MLSLDNTPWGQTEAVYSRVWRMMRTMVVMRELDVMMMMSPGVSDTGGVRDAPRLISSQICERRLCFKLDKVASCPGLGIHLCLQTLGNYGPWCMASLLSSRS